MEIALVDTDKYVAVWEESYPEAQLQIGNHPTDDYDITINVSGKTDQIFSLSDRGSIFKEVYIRLVVGGAPQQALRIEGKANKYAREAHRLFERALRRDIGTKAKLLLIKNKTRCTECWSPIRKAIIEPNCSTCSGTGWIGKTEPIDFFCSFGMAENRVAQIPNQISSQGVEQAWTTAWPTIPKQSLVLRLYDLAVFEVTERQPSGRSGFIVRQTLQLRRLDREDASSKLDDFFD